MLLQMAGTAQGAQVAERIRIAARGQGHDMMHLFGGRRFAIKKAVFAERVRLIVLSAYRSPSFTAVNLHGLSVSRVAVIVPVFFRFMFRAVLTAVYGESRASGPAARPFRFLRHIITCIIQSEEVDTYGKIHTL